MQSATFLHSFLFVLLLTTAWIWSIIQDYLIAQISMFYPLLYLDLYYLDSILLYRKFKTQSSVFKESKVQINIVQSRAENILFMQLTASYTFNRLNLYKDVAHSVIQTVLLQCRQLKVIITLSLLVCTCQCQIRKRSLTPSLSPSPFCMWHADIWLMFDFNLTFTTSVLMKVYYN